MRIFRPLTLSLALAAASPLCALAQMPDTNNSAGSRILDKICNSDRAADRDARLGELMAQRLSLNDQQKALLKELGDARARGGADTRAALCSPRPVLTTLKDRQAFWEALLTARLASLKTARPKADAFYDSLDQAQKANFDQMTERLMGRPNDTRDKDTRRWDDTPRGPREYSRSDDRGRDPYRDRDVYRGRDVYGERDGYRDRDSDRDYRQRDGRYPDRYRDHGRGPDEDRYDRPDPGDWHGYRPYERDRDYRDRDDRYRDSYRPRERNDDWDDE